eukprot:c1643_g1_i1.p1 GENE.c1643_g1_i1~~c1643_g1_i1.p1  ORF type:complete len:437 (-),score=92.78 c1643_g1_i1:70-1380(-)
MGKEKGEGMDQSSEPLLDDPKVTPRQMITTQHYLALAVSFLGWACDTMDSSLFVMVQENVLEDLMNHPSSRRLSEVTAFIYAIQLVGGSVGGVGVGMLCDHFGRSRMLMLTVLIYSVGTALCALSQTWWQLAVLRFITGIGTGGEWACGASLVAEVWPDEYRHIVGPVLQSGGSIGSIIGALVYLGVQPYGWRYVFLCGLAPALLLILMRLFVDESEMWKRSHKNELNTFSAIFSKEHRTDTISVSVLVTTKLFVYYAVMVWVPSIMREEVKNFPQAGWTISDADKLAGLAYILANVGAMFGNLSWIITANLYGRKGTLSYMILSIVLVVPAVFALVHDIDALLVLMPVIGFLLSGFSGGLAIWLPELFPTEMRGTGAAFIYNAGRLVGALGPITTAALVGTMGTYYAAVSVMPMFLIVGMVALLFARETTHTHLI